MRNFDLDNKDGETQKNRQKIINELLASLQNELYYTPTVEIANLIHQKIHTKSALSNNKFSLVEDLTPEDIKILLSFEL